MLGLYVQVLREPDHGPTRYRMLVVIIVIAGIAIVAGATVGRPQAARMAGPARPPRAFVVHVKRVPPIIACRQPAAGVVTGRAVRAQDTGVVARFSVA